MDCLWVICGVCCVGSMLWLPTRMQTHSVACGLLDEAGDMGEDVNARCIEFHSNIADGINCGNHIDGNLSPIPGPVRGSHLTTPTTLIVCTCLLTRRARPMLLCLLQGGLSSLWTSCSLVRCDLLCGS